MKEHGLPIVVGGHGLAFTIGFNGLFPQITTFGHLLLWLHHINAYADALHGGLHKAKLFRLKRVVGGRKQGGGNAVVACFVGRSRLANVNVKTSLTTTDIGKRHHQEATGGERIEGNLISGHVLPSLAWHGNSHGAGLPCVYIEHIGEKALQRERLLRGAYRVLH